MSILHQNSEIKNGCNERNKKYCPLDGKCLSPNIIYQGKRTSPNLSLLWSCRKVFQRYATLQSSHCVKRVPTRSFFWSVFSCIRTEYGDKLRKSPHSVRIQENTDQKKLLIWTPFSQCPLLLKVTQNYAELSKEY